MTNYQLEEKPAFAVLGFGTELKSDYTDFAGIAAEKDAFWQAITADGRLDQLKKIASDDDLFIVNEAIDNKMMHYAAVRTNETLPDADRLIEFPAGEYVVVPGTASSEKELADAVTGAAFGEVLGSLTDVAYVGGPNAAVITDETDGVVTGEMLIPVVRN